MRKHKPKKHKEHFSNSQTSEDGQDDNNSREVQRITKNEQWCQPNIKTQVHDDLIALNPELYLLEEIVEHKQKHRGGKQFAG